MKLVTGLLLSLAVVQQGFSSKTPILLHHRLGYDSLYPLYLQTVYAFHCQILRTRAPVAVVTEPTAASPASATHHVNATMTAAPTTVRCVKVTCGKKLLELALYWVCTIATFLQLPRGVAVLPGQVWWAVQLAEQVPLQLTVQPAQQLLQRLHKPVRWDQHGAELLPGSSFLTTCRFSLREPFSRKKDTNKETKKERKDFNILLWLKIWRVKLIKIITLE